MITWKKQQLELFEKSELYCYQEAYLFDEFEEDFYGSYLDLEIYGFIRCESDFKKFGLNYNLTYFNVLLDHLIKAIHNDAYVALNILNNKYASN